MPADEKGIASSAGRTPRIVRVGTWVLLFILVRGTLGVAFIGRDIYRASAKGRAFETLGLAQAWWVLLWALAGAGLWALGRRRPLGRWLAVGLVLALGCQFLREVWVSLQVMRGHPDFRLVGYKDAGEGLGGVLANLPVALGLVAVGLRLALGGHVGEYFRPGAPASADAGRRPTRS